MKRTKQKYQVFFVKKINGVPNLVGHKRIALTNENITFNKKLYSIDTSQPSYSKRHKIYYFIDIDAEQLLYSTGIKQDIISKEILDQIISKEIIRQMIAAVKPMGTMEKLLYMGMGVLGGVGIGLMIGGYI